VDAGLGSLGQWLWTGTRWQAEELQRWSTAALREAPAKLVEVAAQTDGTLVVVWTVPTEDGTLSHLLFSTREP
jgi:hypothetical protein